MYLGISVSLRQFLIHVCLNCKVVVDPYIHFTLHYICLFSAGITIGALPTLVQKNVAAITVGVNDGTSPPDVPKIFNWKFDDKNSVIAMWIKGTCMAVKGKT